MHTVARGAVMGLADVVPGVSGGTMALVLGIYGRFIAALAALDAQLVVLVFGATSKNGRNALGAHARATDLVFLIQLGLGIALALVAGAHMVGVLIEAYPVALMAVFFGLILASVRLPWSHIAAVRARHFVLAVVGAVAAATLAFLPAASGSPGALVLVGAGFIAICAMLLPGISGSAVLVLIGVYPAVLAAVRELQLVRLALFAAGAALGLLLASRAIRALLRKWADLTLAVLTGLMIGSLVRVWPWRDEGAFGAGHPVVPDLWFPLVWVLVGAAVSMVLEWIGETRTAGSLHA